MYQLIKTYKKRVRVYLYLVFEMEGYNGVE